MVNVDGSRVTINIIDGTKIVYNFSQSKLVEVDIILEGQFFKTVGKVPISRALQDVINYTKKE